VLRKFVDEAVCGALRSIALDFEFLANFSVYDF
jgi:hypothetical protein